MSLNFINTFPNTLSKSSLITFPNKPRFTCNYQSTQNDQPILKTTRREVLVSAAAMIGIAPFLKSTKVQASWTPKNTEVLYDNKSGSFVPTSAIDNLFNRDAGATFDRCIVAGEIHDNMCTHQAQLTVIDSARRLRDGKKLQVGFEQFYRAHDPLLDQYIQGNLTTAELLQKTKWEYIWGFNPDLYVPIFEYCKYHQIPMRGLNVPREFVSYVGKVGIDSMDDRLKEFLPDNMDRSNQAHFTHFVEMIFDGHHGNSIPIEQLKRYYDVQVLWEEWMSQSVAISLNQSPDARMVALIGSGHVEGRFGFPDRIEKRCNERPYTIVPRPVAWTQEAGYTMPSILAPDRNIADLVWYTRRNVDLV